MPLRLPIGLADLNLHTLDSMLHQTLQCAEPYKHNSCPGTPGGQLHIAVEHRHWARIRLGGFDGCTLRLCAVCRMGSTLHTCKTSIPCMYAARRVRLCLPLPPSPTSSALPPASKYTHEHT
jgi:hypothetical protein